MSARAWRIVMVVTLLVALCACGGRPLPSDATALQTELGRRTKEFWRETHAIQAGGFVVFEDSDGRRFESDWRWTALDDGSFELAAGSGGRDVVILNVTRSGGSLWLRPPGRRRANIYQATSVESLQGVAPGDPSIQSIFSLVIALASYGGANALDPDAPVVESETDSIRLHYSRPGGTARLRLRSEDGAAISLQVEYDSPEARGCVSVEFPDIEPPLIAGGLSWPSEARFGIAASCGNEVLLTARLRLRELSFPSSVEFPLPSGKHKPLSDLRKDPVWRRVAQRPL